jgi:hypothetical protein
MSKPDAITDRWRVEAVDQDTGYGVFTARLQQVREPGPGGIPYIGSWAEVKTFDPDLRAALTPGAVVRLVVEPYPETGP